MKNTTSNFTGLCKCLGRDPVEDKAELREVFLLELSRAIRDRRFPQTLYLLGSLYICGTAEDKLKVIECIDNLRHWDLLVLEEFLGEYFTTFNNDYRFWKGL